MPTNASTIFLRFVLTQIDEGNGSADITELFGFNLESIFLFCSL